MIGHTFGKPLVSGLPCMNEDLNNEGQWRSQGDDNRFFCRLIDEKVRRAPSSLAGVNSDVLGLAKPVKLFIVSPIFFMF